MTCIVTVHTPAHAEAVIVVEKQTQDGSWLEARREPLGPGLTRSVPVYGGCRVLVEELPKAEAASPPAPEAPAPAAKPDDQPMPSIGRIVLYHPADHERDGRGEAEFYPAIITRVFSPVCVNLQVLADAGPAFAVTSRVRGEDVLGWHWPKRS